jgi:hypothetical protein
VALHLHGAPGGSVVLTILTVPETIMAVMLHSALWTVIVPLALVILLIALGIVGRKREVTRQQFANDLEKHLLGTEGAWAWDKTTSLAVSDERLDRLRGKPWRFDSLILKRRQEEFKEIIAALRRGEVPDVKDD